MASALRFAVPSLKPSRLRAVDCDVEVDDVRPKPIWEYRTDARPNAMRTRLRTAWTATWGSLAQAWMAMSPPQIAGSSRSPENSGRSLSLSGFSPPSPNRGLPSFSNRPGPNPIVIVRREGGRPSASPVSSGGPNGDPPTAPNVPTSFPCTSLRAATVHSCSIATSSSRFSVVMSSATKYIRSCAGVTMPAW